MSDKHDPNKLLDQLSEATNAAGQAHFNIGAREDIQVQIRPDASVRPAMFVPDPLIPGGYKAHPVTIRALRKDIFAAGEELFEDLEDLITCDSCQHQIDRQFWHFCPYCEAKFRN